MEPSHTHEVIEQGVLRHDLSILLLALYFVACCLAIGTTQLVGAPLYFYNRTLFYSWMAFTKEQFGLVITTTTQWWAPVRVRVSGDESVRGQLKRGENGRLECVFPERMVLIANHQIYTDWAYLWWIAYTSKMHGYIYIVLKDSIKYIPVLGTGMRFFGFIFLSRKWTSDKARFQYRLRKLTDSRYCPDAGPQVLNPMWLLIFPEGTNLSATSRASSKRWADRNNIDDLRHTILPHSTGVLHCLLELQKTVDYMYDCTVAYEGVPVGQYSQDRFTLRTTYLQGRPPKSVSMHWRRFAIKDIPVEDENAFRGWLLARWREKDGLLEYHAQNGRFTAEEDTTTDIVGEKNPNNADYVEDEVQLRNPFEVLQIFVPPAVLILAITTVAVTIAIALRNLGLV